MQYSLLLMDRRETGTMGMLIRVMRLIKPYASEDRLGMRLVEFVALGHLRDIGGTVSQQALGEGLFIDRNNLVLLLNRFRHPQARPRGSPSPHRCTDETWPGGTLPRGRLLRASRRRGARGPYGGRSRAVTPPAQQGARGCLCGGTYRAATDCPGHRCRILMVLSGRC
jgi:hypothetical protein